MFTSIQSRFLTVSSFFMMALAALTGLSALQITRVGGDLAMVTRYIAPMKDGLRDIQLAHLEQSASLSHFLSAAHDRGDTADRLTEVRVVLSAGRAGVIDDFRRLKRLSAEMRAAASDPEVIAGIQRQERTLRTMESRYRRHLERMNAVLDRAAAGDLAAARRDEIALRTDRRAFTARLQAIAGDLAGHAAAAVERAQARENLLFQIEAALFAAVVGAGLVLAHRLARGMSKPVRRLAAATREVQAGRFDAELNVEGRDELARLTDGFNRMVCALRRRDRVHDRFGKHIDPRVVENLIAGETALESGEKRVMTVSVVMLSDFDRLAEHWPPERLRAFLTDYLTAMADPVQSRSGIVDNFYSGKVVAFWGPPFCGERSHARRACEAALDQQARFRALLGKHGAELDDIRTRPGLRIGIATGEVMVGAIGTETRQTYTVVGNCVNHAGRLEKANRIYRTAILIGAETMAAAGETIAVRDLDRVVLAGTEKPSHLFELLGPEGGLSEEHRGRLDLFEQAQAAYRKGDFAEAGTRFRQVLAGDAGDFASQLFLNRMTRLQRREQTREWDGVWIVRDPYDRTEATG